MSTRNISWGVKADNLTIFKRRLSWNLGPSTYWNPQSLFRSVKRLLYLYRLKERKVPTWVGDWASPIGGLEAMKSILALYQLVTYEGRTESHEQRLDSFETCRGDKKLGNKIDYKNCASRWSLTLWHLNFLYNFSTPVFKMWILQEPKRIGLWNKGHLEEKKNGECAACLKYSVSIFVE